MRTGMRFALAAGEIRKALLLAAVAVAMVIPGSDLALGQRGTGTNAQAPLFTAINLHPHGFTKSYALGVSGGQQVGVGVTSEGFNHALLWRGSAASVVDLTPSRWRAEVHAVCGGQQVGYGDGPGTAGGAHALLWRGSAASVVDLNPKRFEGSAALGTSGMQQVGDGLGHALLWAESAGSVVDLHPRGFTQSFALGVSGGEQVGYGSGQSTGERHHALLWHGGAASVVDLNPRGFSSSEAHGISGAQQVGYGSFGLITEEQHHALLWYGSATTVVDLNPPRFWESYAYATNGAEQVGVGDGPATQDEAHALLWRGSAASVVDLHSFLPPSFVSSAALAIATSGDIVGSASTVAGPAGDDYAILWKRNVPKPGTSNELKPTGC